MNEFEFPKKEELNIFLKDILEEEVDEKYYLRGEQISKIMKGYERFGSEPEKEKAIMIGNLSRYKMKSPRNPNFKEKGISWCVDTRNSNGILKPKIIGNVNPSGKGMNGNVYAGDVAPTITTNKGEGAKIIQVGMINQTCKKRTFETPKEINEYLKNNKGNYTIKEIADYLGMPKTQVEHYFRTDKSRAIPDILTWFELQKLLGFDDTWNTEVATFHKKEIEFESSRRVYSEEGIAPTISAANADKIVQLNNPKHSNNRVYSGEGISPALNTMQGGNRQPFLLDLYNKKIKNDGVSICLTEPHHNNLRIYDHISIRKLTPKECFRLMGFLDDEINLEGISNSQQYKLAGNGWDINLVAKIFKAMNIPNGTKLFEMFSGYGGASFGLKKAGIDFECVGTSEIDKYAIQCYAQNHKGENYGDCNKINPRKLPDFDLLTGGFPCQAFSVAGKGLGEQDTRGTLFYEIIRIAEVKKPKYMLLENVRGLLSAKHQSTFNKIKSELDRIGYDLHIKVLNSKEHGIPQNRQRVFFVCFRKDLKMGIKIKQTKLSA